MNQGKRQDQRSPFNALIPGFARLEHQRLFASCSLPATILSLDTFHSIATILALAHGRWVSLRWRHCMPRIASVAGRSRPSCE